MTGRLCRSSRAVIVAIRSRFPVPGSLLPPTLLLLGIDLGGTSVKLGIADATGSPRARAIIATEPTRGSDDVIDRIAQAARALIEQTGSVAACGIGVPAELDASRRRLV